MSRPGQRPGLRQRALGAGLVTFSLVAAACGGTGATTSDATTGSTIPWVVGTGGTLTIGIDQVPTGCNPNTATGDTWADRLLLAPVLPSAFNVNGKDQPVYDSAVIDQAELQSTSPQTVVYTINPSAVWSDGVPITASDFIYTWRQQRGPSGPVGLGIVTSATGTGTTATTTTTSSSTTTTSPGSSGSGGTGHGSSTTTTSPTTSSTTPTSTTTAPSTTAPETGTTTPSTTAPGTSTTTPTSSTSGATGSSGSPGAGAATTTDLPGATGTTGTLMGYRQIKSVKGSNHGRTVTVVFRTHYADWQALFNDLMPAHVLEKTGWDPSCSTIDPKIDLSGGPYVIQSVVPGKKIVLTRNPKWWEQPGNASRIVVKTASSAAQLAHWVVTHQVQVALPTRFDQHFLADVSASPGVQSQEEQSTTFLQLELSTTGPDTAYLGVRQAIAHAVNRQALVNQVAGWADTSIVPATSHLYAQSQSGYPSPRQEPIQIAEQSSTTTTTTIPATPTPSAPFPTRADLATTSRLLSQAGYVRLLNGTWQGPNGKPLTLRLTVDGSDPWAARTAPLLAHQLTAAGLPTTVLSAPTATAAGTDLSTGAADLALLPMHSSPYATTAIAWYTQLLGPPGSAGSQDWTNFTNPSLDALLVKASRQLNPVDASPLYTQADMLLWQQMVALPLFTEPAVMAWSGSVGGVQTDLNGPNVLTTVANWGIKVPPSSPRAVGTG